ncbi:DUF1254 domain-containing protein [Methylocapsa palsarum]|uniref:Uncharacterized membrane protein n=1 Tax=Methylocapsa palsarum TaxID=1612308 RepID=A0A1I3XSM1_9HYPH|nr:hypothetical protein [Methylocapsa palsarum]SFK22530.1 Uncharacterized membrane protein [Methylocapsa palsarum]
MTSLDRALSTLLWLLALIFIAGLAHILTIFYLPTHFAKVPMETFAAFAKQSQLTLLPQAAPGASLTPFADPATVQGICTFDLAQGPLHVHGDVDRDRLLTMSFRTPAGMVFYSLTNRAAQKGKLDILLLNTAQLEALEAEDDAQDEGAPAQDLRLLSPTEKGFVLLSALANFPSETADAEQRVKAFTCETQEPATD